jgi:hypothetical protein
MSFKKIETPNYKPPCKDRQHNPPSAIVLKPGIYEWSCPSCGHKVRINIPHITC